MYITEVLTKTTTGKVAHRCILLRESYREDGKVKTRTLANLTHCPPHDIAALRWALHHKQAFLSPADSARVLERLADGTLRTEDRALLEQFVRVIHGAPSRLEPPGPSAARKATPRSRRAVPIARRHPEP
jgi:hypothetical protein